MIDVMFLSKEMRKPIMKIGQLANKNNISSSTIYYYIDMGLLVPENSSSQYDFSEQDERDLKMILMLKKCHFPLVDIHHILSLIRMTNLKDNGDINDYLSYFFNQRDSLMDEKAKIEIAINEINQIINKKIENPIDSPAKTGVPLEMVQYLYCPKCKKKLNLTDVSIRDKYILSGKLLCDCSYKAKIENGIVITEGLFISPYEAPDTNRSFLKDLPADCISVFKKSFNWMMNRLSNEDTNQKVIFEDHMNTYFFLYPNICKINNKAYYIMSDKFLPIVEMYKQRIEALNLDLNILYMVNSSYEYPLKDGCVDIFLDFFTSNKFNFIEKYYYLDKISYLFNNTSKVIGTYFYYKNKNKSVKEAINQYTFTWENIFNVVDFKNNFLNSGKFKLIEEQEIGQIIDVKKSQYFTYHIKGEKMRLLSFVWQKQDCKISEKQYI